VGQPLADGGVDGGLWAVGAPLLQAASSTTIGSATNAPLLNLDL
jgi:hypothetical protein